MFIQVTIPEAKPVRQRHVGMIIAVVSVQMLLYDSVSLYASAELW